MSQQPTNDKEFEAGLALLARPLMPLARIVQMLYLTGPFDTVAEVVAELNEPIETNSATYADPAALLRPHLDLLKEFERFKHPQPPLARILDEEENPVDPMEAIALYVGQQLLIRELETINSLLCAPCGCTLCCTGPDNHLQQDFFEIPLREDEPVLFPLPRVDNQESREKTPYDEPPLLRNGQHFYETGAALYHWRNGWSMILPRHTACPHLAPENGHCTIYPQRPDVCRRPQIFPYALEREPGADIEFEGRMVPGFINRSKLLAIWDCPYVKRFQDQIGKYAETCGLEPIFKENKS